MKHCTTCCYLLKWFPWRNSWYFYIFQQSQPYSPLALARYLIIICSNVKDKITLGKPNEPAPALVKIGAVPRASALPYQFTPTPDRAFWSRSATCSPQVMFGDRRSEALHAVISPTQFKQQDCQWKALIFSSALCRVQVPQIAADWV